MTNPRAALEVTTPNDLEIVITRSFNAPRDLVFDAFTSCEHLKHWWGPRTWSLPGCEIDLRVGGRWHFFMRSNDGEEMGMHGEYREIDRPARVVQTESFDGEMFEPMGGGTLNTLVLDERDGRTTTRVTVVYKSKEARDGVLQFPMEEGLAEGYERLDELLANIKTNSQR